MIDSKIIYNFIITCITCDLTILAFAGFLFVIPFTIKQEFTIKILYNAELLFLFFLILSKNATILWKWYNTYFIENVLYQKLELTYKDHFFYIAFAYYIGVQIMLLILLFRNQEIHLKIAVACLFFVLKSSFLDKKTKDFLCTDMRLVLHVTTFFIIICFLIYLDFDLDIFCKFLYDSWIDE